MDVYEVIQNWWKQATLFGLISTAGAYLWAKRETLKEIGEFLWSFRDRFEKVENKVNNPVSAEAKHCPTCDERLACFDSANFQHWFYRCNSCAQTFKHPAPTAPYNRTR